MGKAFGIIDERYDQSETNFNDRRRKAKEILSNGQYRKVVEVDRKMREIFSRLYQHFIDDIILEAIENPDQKDLEENINYYPITIHKNSQGEGYRRVSNRKDIYGLYTHELKAGGTREAFFESIPESARRDMQTNMGVDIDVAMLRAKLHLHRKISKMESRIKSNNNPDGESILGDEEEFELYLYTHHGDKWVKTIQDAIDSVKKAFDLLSGSGTYGRENAFDYYDELSQTRLLSILSAIAPIGEIVPRGGRGYFFINPFDETKLPELVMSKALKNYMLGKKEWILENVLSQGHEMAQGYTTGLGCPVRNTGQIEKIAQAMISLARRFHDLERD